MVTVIPGCELVDNTEQARSPYYEPYVVNLLVFCFGLLPTIRRIY